MSGRRRPILGVRHLLLFLTAIGVWEATAAQTTTTTTTTRQDDNNSDNKQDDDNNNNNPRSKNRSNNKNRNRMGTMSRPSISSKSMAHKVSTATPLRIIHDGNNGSSTSSDFPQSSIRMQDYRSLAHCAEYLFQKNNLNEETSFQNLLRQEEEERIKKIASTTNHSSSSSSSSPPPRISLQFISVIGSAILFALSAFVWDPTSAQSLWKTVINKKLGAALAVAWLPWCWYHPAKLALLDLFILTQIVRQPAVLPYLQKEVFPILWKTIRTMLITEAWTRTWKWVFANVDQVRQFVLQKYYENSQSSVQDEQQQQQKEKESSSSSWKDGHLVFWPGSEEDPPSWLVQLHVAIVGSVEKGIKSNLKKTFQETIVSAFEVWKSALQEQIIIAATGISSSEIEINVGDG